MTRVILSRAAAKDLKWRSLRFLRFRFALLSVSVGMTLVASAANACPVCFGGPNSLGKGTDAAIWFLLAVIAFVQLGFVALFWSFWKRAKELRRKRESFHLIEGGVR